MHYAGRCLCGDVTYSANAEAIFQGNCYCRDCQKESGTGHITGVAVPEALLSVSGETRSYTKPADSGGTIENHFCARCGTTLYHKPSNVPGVAILRAGTLDPETPVEPQMNLYVASARAWDPPAAGLPGFAGMPTD